jgi:hypothetical protein
MKPHEIVPEFFVYVLVRLREATKDLNVYDLSPIENVVCRNKNGTML